MGRGEKDSFYYHVYYHVYQLLSLVNRIINPFRDPINLLNDPIRAFLLSFTLTPTLSRHKGEGENSPNT